MIGTLGKWIVYGCLFLLGFATSGLADEKPTVILYTSAGCRPCRLALESLRELGIDPTVTRDCPNWVHQVPTVHWQDTSGRWFQHAPQHWSGKNWSELETEKLRRWLLTPSATKSTATENYLTVSALVEIMVDRIRVAFPLFASVHAEKPESAKSLKFEQIDRRTMEELNRHWHSRLPEFRTACPCTAYYGAEFGGLWYAVAAWSPPVARMLPSDWLELRRLAISDDAPKYTATRFIGWMVRNIKRQFPEVKRLISYQDTAAHSGTIYKAAGWNAASVSQDGKQWNCPSRPRDFVQSDAAKVRWELEVSRG